MRNRDILQGVLAYIDAHLREALCAETLAQVAGFSPFHFQKLFLWGTGYTVMGYVRCRRLAFAAAELSAGRRILDIALDYGFDTHSGFSKAFRRHFGCAPDTYRIHAHCDVPPLPSLAHMEKYAIGGIVMEPKLVTLPEIHLVGYSMDTRSTGGENRTAIPAFWLQYMQGGDCQKLHAAPFCKRHDEYGVCFPENPETCEFTYMIGCEKHEGAEIPEGFVQRTVPAATYAVFSTPPTNKANFSASIQGVWDYIFNEWFPTSGYEYAPGCVDFERYDERCMTENENVCDIYIPVVKK